MADRWLIKKELDPGQYSKSVINHQPSAIGHHPSGIPRFHLPRWRRVIRVGPGPVRLRDIRRSTLLYFQRNGARRKARWFLGLRRRVLRRRADSRGEPVGV